MQFELGNICKRINLPQSPDIITAAHSVCGFCVTVVSMLQSRWIAQMSDFIYSTCGIAHLSQTWSHFSLNQ